MGRVLKSRPAVAVAAFIVGVGVAAGVAWAAVPDSATGVITACYPTSGPNTGALRVIDHQAGANCAAGEASVSWPTRTVCLGYPHTGVDWSIPGSTPGNGCNFTGANLGAAVLGQANLTNANFTNVNLRSAGLGFAKVSGVNFTHAVVGGVTATQHTNLAGVVGLTNAQVRSVAKVSIVLCNGTNISAPNLTGAILTGLNWSAFDLNAMMLLGANLSGDALNGANFTKANLASANLTSANLTNANFTCARLDDATLTGAIVTGATWNDTTCPDGTNSNDHGNTCVGHL